MPHYDVIDEEASLSEEDQGIMARIETQLTARSDTIDRILERMYAIHRVRRFRDYAGHTGRVWQGAAMMPTEWREEFLIDLEQLDYFEGARSIHESWVSTSAASKLYQIVTAHYLRQIQTPIDFRLSILNEFAFMQLQSSRRVSEKRKRLLPTQEKDPTPALRSWLHDLREHDQVFARALERSVARQRLPPGAPRYVRRALVFGVDFKDWGHVFLLVLDIDEAYPGARFLIVDNCEYRGQYHRRIYKAFCAAWEDVWPESVPPMTFVLSRMGAPDVATGSCVSFAFRAAVALALLEAPYVYLHNYCVDEDRTSVFSRFLFMQIARMRHFLLKSIEVWDLHASKLALYVPQYERGMFHDVDTDYIWLVEPARVRMELADLPHYLRHCATTGAPPEGCTRFQFKEPSYDDDERTPAFGDPRAPVHPMCVVSACVPARTPCAAAGCTARSWR